MSRRLIALITVAIVMGLAFGGLRVASAAATAATFGRTNQLAQLGLAVTDLAQAMENERDLAAGQAAYSEINAPSFYAAPIPNPPPPPPTVVKWWQPEVGQAAKMNDEFSAAVKLTDGIASRVRGLIAAIGPAFPASTRTQANSVLSLIGRLPGLRSEAGNQAPATVIQDYSAALATLFTFNDGITSESADPTMAQQVRCLGAMSRAKDQFSQQRAIIYAAIIEGTVGQNYGLKTLPQPGATPGALTLAKIQQAVANQNATGTLLTQATAVGTTIGAQAMTDAGGLQALTISQGLQSADLLTFLATATQQQQDSFLSQVNKRQTGTANVVNAFVTAAGNPYFVLHGSTNQPALSPGTSQIPGLTPTGAADTWFNNAAGTIGLMRSLETGIADNILARSQLLQHDAKNSAMLTAAITTGVLLVVLVATLLVARSLVNPLRRLQTDALEIAAVRLPARVAAMAAEPDPGGIAPRVEPIGVRSRDEIGRVARAFDQVHAEAVRLAGNEAAMRGNLNSMFISLSRRSVPLIDRLARMIDAMEQNEDNPDQLANLFSMDHLVTRMRRNSENLLVLAGEEPVRKWAEPVPLADITRAAASEIEQYPRVLLSIQPGILVSGLAAADVVHLLAELIENATMFSPRDTQVELSAQAVTTGGVLIEIRDNGVGISPNRLEDMNWRLDNPPLIDVSVSRHMGLFAVSRLAARHGVRVRLRAATPQGLIALVWLPGQLVSQDPGTLSGGQLRAFGAEPAYVEYGSPVRRLPGRHRSELAHQAGGQPELAGAGQRALGGRRTPDPRAAAAAHGGQSGWFRAKRPSGRGDDPWEPDEQPSAAWVLGGTWATGAGGWEAAGWRPDGSAALTVRNGAAQNVRTSAGLPRRVPRAGAAAPAGAGGGWAASDNGAGGGLTGSYQSVRDTGPQRVLDQQRSPEVARSRLSGFQLGSREATGQSGSYRWPPAGEETGR